MSDEFAQIFIETVSDTGVIVWLAFSFLTLGIFIVKSVSYIRNKKRDNKDSSL